MRSVLCTLRLLLLAKSFILVLQKMVLQTVRVSFSPKRACRAEKDVSQYLDGGIGVGGEVGGPRNTLEFRARRHDGTSQNHSQ